MALPLVSVFVDCSAGESLWLDSLKSVLAQDYQGPMEVIFSDDGSKDSRFDQVEELVSSYHGSFDLILNCNERPLGFQGHLQQVLANAQGGLFVYQRGDAVARLDRVRKLVETWLVYQPVLLCSTVGPAAAIASQEGPLPIEILMSSNLVRFESFAWDQRLQLQNELIPALPELLLLAKAILAGGLWFVPDALLHREIPPMELVEQEATLGERVTALKAVQDLLTVPTGAPHWRRTLQDQLAEIHKRELGTWLQLRQQLRGQGLLPGWG